ncbi:hypothetical protein CPB85DRAFT_1439363 [Mucidula mucida]|nr:hypothetical protein CPB85DRAFT_1439363 [Mucidula mucida]
MDSEQVCGAVLAYDVKTVDDYDHTHLVTDSEDDTDSEFVCSDSECGCHSAVDFDDSGSESDDDDDDEWDFVVINAFFFCEEHGNEFCNKCQVDYRLSNMPQGMYRVFAEKYWPGVNAMDRSPICNGVPTKTASTMKRVVGLFTRAPAIATKRLLSKEMSEIAPGYYASLVNRARTPKRIYAGLWTHAIGIRLTTTSSTGTEDSAFNDLCSAVVGLAKHFDEGQKSLLVRDDFKDDSACICIRILGIHRLDEKTPLISLVYQDATFSEPTGVKNIGGFLRASLYAQAMLRKLLADNAELVSTNYKPKKESFETSFTPSFVVPVHWRDADVEVEYWVCGMRQADGDSVLAVSPRLLLRTR